MTFKRSTAFALIVGVVGLLLRLTIWSAAYNSSTRLIVKPGLVLIFNLFFALCALVVALLFLLRWPNGGTALSPFPSATPLRRILRVAAALCSMAAGALLLFTLMQSRRTGTVLLLTGGLMALQGLILLLLTLMRQTDTLSYATWLLLPAFCACFFNIGMYQQLGAEPNPQVYMWPVLSMLISAAGWVSYTGFAYQRQSGRLFGLLSHIALLTLPVALAAPLPLAWRVYLCSPLFWFWAALISLRAVPPESVPSAPDAETLPESGEDDEPLSATITVVEEEFPEPPTAPSAAPANGPDSAPAGAPADAPADDPANAPVSAPANVPRSRLRTDGDAKKRR